MNPLPAVSCMLPVLALVLSSAPLEALESPGDASASDRAALEHFELRVRPLLAEHCYRCHGEEKAKGELRLDSRAAILRGGESGPALVPGDPSSSRLLRAVRYEGGLEMPPDQRLAPREIEALELWIEAGAPWPTEAPEASERSSSASSSGDGSARSGDGEITAQDREWWSFRPISRPTVPRVERADWVANPIDAFVLARLENAGLAPSAAATPAELVRRVTFDLIGLPPSLDDVRDFERDPSPDAWDRLVDRLLASPAFGERWGRHWLDVVRFAQTNGYERDDEKPAAWRYRDWVVDALNEDLPYADFVRAQVAGDEIEDRSPATVTATGFYRLGVWDDEPDDALMAEYDGLDDIVRTTGAAFLGLTVGCARCHRHMFDPIPHEDYYRFLAFFDNVRPYEKPSFTLDSATYAPLASEDEVAAWTADRDARARAIEERMAAAGGDDARKSLEAELQRVRGEAPPFEWALAVRERKSEPRPVHVHIRGDAHREGDEVEPAIFAVFGGSTPEITPTRFGTTGRRRALAEWITSPENPLTARVFVNRLWQHLFGRGIVRTPNDFGRAGVAPTHPELLDWLAAEFLANGTSVKRTLRTILGSATYRMSSRADPACEREVALDPENELFWRQNLRRLEAEAIRDALLAVTGELDRRMGGRGFFPHLPGEVVAGQSRPGLGWEISSADDRARRSLYAFVKRTMRVPFLEAFDYANTDQPLGVRPVTTVAPQALFLLNGDFVRERASALASRIREEAGADRERWIDCAWSIALARAPTEKEREIARTYLADEEALARANPPPLAFKPEAPPALERHYLAKLAPGDFISGPVDGWTYHRGVWLDRGEDIFWADVARGPFALWSGGRFDDFAIEGRMTLGPGAIAGAWIFRAEPRDDGSVRGYEVAIEPQRSEIVLRRIGEIALELARVPWKEDTNGAHVLRVAAKGPRITVSTAAESALSIDVVDPEPLLGPGQLGFRAFGAEAHLREVVVETEIQRLAIEPASAPEPSESDPAPRGSALRRALEALSLVVLNLNEFVYVD